MMTLKKAFTPLLIAVMIAMISAWQPLRAEFNEIKFKQETLENGFQVIYHIDRSAPKVAVVLHYRVGSRYETKGQTGYAHFFEHLMFESTDNIPRHSMDKFVIEAGGTLNAATFFDQTVFHFVVPSNEIRLPLWIESQRMRRLHVDTIGVETQRGVVLEELKQTTTNQPYGLLLKKLCANLFPGTNYSWPVIGYAADIEKATIDDFRNFYDKYYQPGNATLVIAGDFDLRDTKKYVHDYFGQYPTAEIGKPEPIDAKPLQDSYTETVKDKMTNMPGVFMGFRVPEKTNDDYYALSLLSDILTSGESSRFYRKLVAEEGLAVEAAAFDLTLEKAGAIILYGICDESKSISDVKSMIIDEIEKVIEKGVSQSELQKAKNITETSFVSGKKDVLEKAKELARYNSYYDNPALINTEIEKYLSVTVDDIKRVAKKYFETDDFVTLYFYPEGYDD